MENTKLITLLKTFSRSEFLEFKQFIASPFFNSRKDLIPFYNYLRKQGPHFDPAHLKQEVVYKKVFPGKPFDSRHLQKMASNLLKLGERYIGIKSMEEEGNHLRYHTIKSCLDRKLPKHADLLLQRHRRCLDQSQQRNAQYFYNEFRFSELAARHHINRQDIRSYNQHLQFTSDSLDLFYLAEKLKHSCIMINNQQYAEKPYELGLLADLQARIHLSNYREHPVIRTYASIFEVLNGRSVDRHFPILKETLDAHLQYFEKDEIRSLYYYGINYYIGQLKTGQKELLREVLDLYVSGVRSEALLPNGEMAFWDFKNIIKLATGLQRYNWIKEFIHQYAPMLPEEHRQNALHYNLAEWNFHQGNYEAAIELLNQVTYSDIYYQLDSKVMLMKIYYETSEFEALSSVIPAFVMFLRRTNKIHHSVRQSYLNFCKILNRLQRKVKDNCEETRTMIAQTPNLHNRNWLQQQVGLVS